VSQPAMVGVPPAMVGVPPAMVGVPPAMVGVPTRHGWCPHQPSVAELAQVLSVGQGNGLTWANKTNYLPFHG